MPDLWVIARHPDVGAAVLPAAAVESYPGWAVDSEPTADPDALRGALELERLDAARAAEAKASAKPAPPAGAPAKTSAAPAADPEEK